MMNKFVLGQTLMFCYQQLSDEILSWMTKIWMKNYLVRDGTCNTVNL